MKDIFPTLQSWQQQQQAFALARVIKTWGSSPRPVGSAMIVSKNMDLAGSVSGGCVEGAVLKAAMPLIENGMSQKLAFGVTDEEAWSVGLSCGGKIQVFAERFMAFSEDKSEQVVWENLAACLQENKPCVLLTKIEDGPNFHILVFPDGSTVGQTTTTALTDFALKAYKERKNQTEAIEGITYFAHVFPRKSQLLIIGAAHITVDLVQLAKLYDFETIVIDPRGVFANKTAFPVSPDQLFVKYPAEVLSNFELDAYTYAVVLSHDPKIDDNALHLLLPSEVAYIGALGSRRTHAKRVARLTEAGFDDNRINKIHAPIGVSINAKKPKEIAMSIMAEIIQVQNQFL